MASGAVMTLGQLPYAKQEPLPGIFDRCFGKAHVVLSVRLRSLV